jgi:hypothetical protein
MGKASSPVRLDKDLMKAATLSSALQHRSAVEQVEYWADLGRKVSSMINPEALISVQAGLSRITLEETPTITPDPDDVFASLAISIELGSITKSIVNNSVRYQKSNSHPGLLEEVSPDGNIVVGEFKDGDFKQVIFA